jgi:hypothetical protein
MNYETQLLVPMNATVIDNLNSQMDKASLLAKVVSHLKELKRSAAEDFW